MQENEFDNIVSKRAAFFLGLNVLMDLNDMAIIPIIQLFFMCVWLKNIHLIDIKLGGRVHCGTPLSLSDSIIALKNIRCFLAYDSPECIDSTLL